MKGFNIHPVTHGSYPAAVRSHDSDSVVPGTLIYDVNAADMAILDLFEDEYVHEEVPVYSSPDSEPIAAKMYLWNSNESLLDRGRVWSYQDDFEAHQEKSASFRSGAAQFRQQALDTLANQQS